MDKKYSIELTIDELLLIDTKVSEEAQKVINKAKKESSYGFPLPIMNEILRKSEETGFLKWSYKQIRSCSYCGKQADYYRYPRSGRYHSKGDKNFNQPIYYYGIAFNEGFVRVQGAGDMCCDCAEKHNVINSLIDYIIDNDLKIQIQDNKYKPSKYLKDDIKICHSCNKEMQVSKMGKLQAIMGGYYEGKCPYCGAEALPFGKSHKSTNKFVMIDNPEFKEEVQLIKKMIEDFNESVPNKDDKLELKKGTQDNNFFTVEETKWRNGYRRVIGFDVADKTFRFAYFSNTEIAQLLTDELISRGYKENKR